MLAPAWRAFSSQCSGTEGHAGYYRKGSGGDQADTRQHAENGFVLGHPFDGSRSEEHTSELQSLMRNSYAVFCLKKKNKYHKNYMCKTQKTIKMKHRKKYRKKIQQTTHESIRTY